MCEARIVIRGPGIDSVEVERMEKVVEKGDKFIRRVSTPKESAQYQQLKGKRKVEYLGGRFSLKKSFSKVLGTGLDKYVSSQNIETLWGDLGHPVMTSTKFSGSIFASITHDDHEIIVGVVLGELN